MLNDGKSEDKPSGVTLGTNLVLLGNYLLRQDDADKAISAVELGSLGPSASSYEEAERLWKEQAIAEHWAKQKGLIARKQKLYLIGSLRNAFVPELAKRLRTTCPTTEIFDDWYSAGPEADDYWKSYEQGRRSYVEALGGYAATHVFDFDKHHLDTSTHALLVLPAGKSGHMEVMYAQYGAGAKTAILLEQGADPRWDVMYKFVENVFETIEEVEEWLGE